MDWFLRNLAGGPEDRNRHFSEPDSLASPSVCCALKQSTNTPESPITPTSVSELIPSFGGDDRGERLVLLWQAYHSSQRNNPTAGSTDDQHINATFDVLLTYLEAFNTEFAALSNPAGEETEALSLFVPPAQITSTSKPKRHPSRTSSTASLESGPKTPSSAAVSLMSKLIPSAAGSPTRKKVAGPVENIKIQRSGSGAGDSEPKPTFGHPHGAVIDSLDGLRHFASHLKTRMQGDVNDTMAYAEKLWICVAHVEVLVRYEGNRDCVLRHGGLKTIVFGILKPLAADNPRFFALNHQLSAIVSNIIVGGLTIFCRCVDPRNRWREYIVGLFNSSPSPKLIPLHSDGIQPEIDAELIDNMAGAILNILDTFKKLEVTDQTSNRMTKVLVAAVNSLGSCMLVRPPLIRSHIENTQLISSLLDLLSSPSVDDMKNALQFRNSFKVWLMALVSILHVMNFNSVCSRKVEELNGLSSIGQCILRISAAEDFNLTTRATSASPYTDFQELGPPNPWNTWHAEAAAIIDLPSDTTVPSLTISTELHILICIIVGSPMLIENNQKVDTIKSTKSLLLNPRDLKLGEWSFRIQKLIGVFLNLFENGGEDRLEPLNASENVIPWPQLATLLFFKKMLGFDLPAQHTVDNEFFKSRRNLSIGWLGPLKVWEVLFGPRFYDHALPNGYSWLLKLNITEFALNVSSLDESPKESLVIVLFNKVLNSDKIDCGPCAYQNDLIRLLDQILASFPLEKELPADVVSAFTSKPQWIESIVTETILASPPSIIGGMGGDSWNIYRLKFLSTCVIQSLPIAYLVVEMMTQVKVLDILCKLNDNTSDIADMLLVSLLSKLLSIEETSLDNSADSSIQEWISSFLASFPESISDQNAYSILLRLLKIVQNALQSLPLNSSGQVRIRAGFIRNHIFERLLSLLDVDLNTEGKDNEEQIKGVVISVLLTIGVILNGSLFAKHSFRLLDGYDEIWLYSRLEGTTLGAKNVAELPIVDNMDALEGLLNMYHLAPSSTQHFILEKLDILAKGHRLNRISMSNSGFCTSLLEKILPYCRSAHLTKCLDILKAVATFSISVSECKVLLKCLRPIFVRNPASGTQTPIEKFEGSVLAENTLISGLNEVQDLPSLKRDHVAIRVPFYYDQLLESVVKLAEKKESNMDIFYFPGHAEAGILLPPLTKWPAIGNAVGGYSLVAWIKFDGEHYPGGKIEKAVVWSIKAVSGDGVEVTIEENIVVLRVIRNGKSYQLSASNLNIIADR
ncbi:hypothetical protein HDV05_007997 [Chytridiales sp. JEL 0842]|nr:hypothetical protein HDV05_007997 [Chytridiales sp. JEL 0842]